MTNLPGHQALRKGRTSLPGQIYLLTTATEKRALHFADWHVARATCQQIFEPSTWDDALLLCWVLMPDHWHGLVQLGAHDGLPLVMNRFKSLTTKHVRQTTGLADVWARGFHDHALRRDEDVRKAARYIVANPLRAQLVREINDYPYWNSV